MHLDLDNVEGPAGDYSLDRQPPKAPSPSASGAAKTVQLRAKQRDRVTVPLNASRRRAPATVKVAINGPGGFALERSYALASSRRRRSWRAAR